LSVMDVAVLLVNMMQAAEEDDIGFEDCKRTLNEVARYWSKPTYWERASLESSLWSCNLRSEKGRFWHPYKLTFDQWMNKLGLKKEFNKKYNFLTDVED